MPQITHFELGRMPTLAQGQAADLKIDTGTMRVWLSRCSLLDGETQPIQVERLVGGCWVDVTGEAGPKYSSYKDHYLDGAWSGFFVTCLTRKPKE